MTTQTTETTQTDKEKLEALLASFGIAFTQSTRGDEVHCGYDDAGRVDGFANFHFDEHGKFVQLVAYQ